MRLLALLLCLTACGHDRDNPEHSSPVDLPALQEAAQVERAALTAVLTPTLYENVQDCDWTLWCGIAKGAGLACDIDQAEYPEPGYIQRRPVVSCFDGADHGSKSTVSNDQITGYMLARWRSADKDALGRLYTFGVDNNWQMGEPADRPGEVLLKPGLEALLATMVGGQPLPYTYLSVDADYARHVQMLQILMWGEVDAASRGLLAIDDQMLQRVNENAAAMPDDYFFQSLKAVYDGRYDGAIDLLLRRNRGEVQPPTYVRGERPDLYARIHWLFAADLVLRHQAK